MPDLTPDDVADLEFPRWAHPPGRPDVLVSDAEAYCRVMNEETPKKPGRPRKAQNEDH